MDVSPDNPCFASVDGVLYDKNLGVLIRWPEGKMGAVEISNGVTGIGDYAFAGNRIT